MVIMNSLLHRSKNNNLHDLGYATTSNSNIYPDVNLIDIIVKDAHDLLAIYLHQHASVIDTSCMGDSQILYDRTLSRPWLLAKRAKYPFKWNHYWKTLRNLYNCFCQTTRDSPWLTILFSYNSTGKSDLQLALILMTLIASPWSHNQHLGAWQLASIYNGCRVPGSCNCHLWPSEPVIGVSVAVYISGEYLSSWVLCSSHILNSVFFFWYQHTFILEQVCLNLLPFQSWLETLSFEWPWVKSKLGALFRSCFYTSILIFFFYLNKTCSSIVELRIGWIGKTWSILEDIPNKLWIA